MMKFSAGILAKKTAATIRLTTAIACAAGLATGASAQLSTPELLADLNTKEQRASNVWQLRAGLNVAALQCQFSPFLAAVPNYNALLRQHSDELADSFKSMTGYFVRLQGAKNGQRAFDRYATRTNQNWATFDAQYSFCNAAANVGRRALYIPKGQFGDFAASELAGLRNSLIVEKFIPVALRPKLEWAIVPVVGECNKKGRCKPTV